MPVSVRLRLRSLRSEGEADVIAIINTGFTSDDPDIMLPQDVASRLGLWPPPAGAYFVSAGTAGGDVVVYVVPRAVEVSVVEEDRIVGPVTCNAIVNPLMDEVLVSDYLTEALRIQPVFPRSGFWRFSDDPPGRLRQSRRGL